MDSKAMRSLPRIRLGPPKPKGPTRPMPEYIYFIQDDRGGPIKIGRSEVYPNDRMRVIQIHYPYPLHILGTILTENPRAEAAVHDYFSHLRLEGEWFRPEPELIKFIEDHAEPYERQYFYKQAKRRHGVGGQPDPDRQKPEF